MTVYNVIQEIQVLFSDVSEVTFITNFCYVVKNLFILLTLKAISNFLTILLDPVGVFGGQ